MAFNQPIEADRPDDLGPFTIFSKAPLYLMWLLGGDMSTVLEDDEDKRKDSCVAKILDDEERREYEEILSMPLNSSGLSVVPDRVLSDISEVNSKTNESGKVNEIDQLNRSFNQINLKQNSPNNFSQKKMSWSDETGQSLVEYLDESSSRDPPPSSFPIKSVMKRSKSSYTNSLPGTATTFIANMPNNSSEFKSEFSNCAGKDHSLLSDSVKHRYLPSGLDRRVAPGGIVFPNGAHLKSLHGGHISPQWGWYISTTPPLQEMYGSKINFNERKEVTTVESESKLNTVRKENIPLPVFTQSVGSPSLGWPNVPL